MKSLTVQMLQTMSDNKWYSNLYLSQNFGWRFSARIHLLKTYGVKFSKKNGESYTEYWRIDKIPSTIVWKNRNSIKLVKPTNWFQRLFTLSQ